MPMLTQKSQVTIPKKVRKILGIGPGDEIDFDIVKNKIILHKKKKDSIIDKYRGFLGQSKTEEIMEELR
ncbi:AbrB/MazE/SpoVT family DNA-binding domain-containing protein [Candidatus Woesearchaeota archaeon]|nr:AbrB/MazE/SpoVT family DNA-binding domain-containing protein [Candidatus Woesearchaeota archaeon]